MKSFVSNWADYSEALEPQKQWLRVFSNFIKKETLALVFSWEFCKIYKNTFFRGYFSNLLLDNEHPSLHIFQPFLETSSIF